mgnify:CR=1 FL=1
MKELLDERYRFKAVKNSIKMSTKSLMARDDFISTIDNKDVYEKQECYVCYNAELKVISEVDRYGFYYPTGFCGECGNVQQAEYYDNDTLINFYSNYYRKIYGNTPPSELYYSQRDGKGNDICSFVSSVCEPKRILEVGCGAGGILAAFRDNGCDVLGLDFDDDYLNIAKRHGLQVVNGSLDKLNNDEKFDLIILSHVLEHIIEPVQFLKTLSKHLAGDGIIYIEVPSLNHVCDGGYKFDLLRYWQNAHTVHFTTMTLALLCKRVGLKNVKQTNFIHSCWKKADDGQVLSQEEKDISVANTKELLLKIESRRKSFRAKANNVKNDARRIIVNTLDLFGVKGIFKTLYYNVEKFLRKV